MRERTVEVRKFAGHPSIVIIDGEPYPVSVAAERLGFKPKSFQQRIARNADLTRPLQRKTFE